MKIKTIKISIIDDNNYDKFNIFINKIQDNKYDISFFLYTMIKDIKEIKELLNNDFMVSDHPDYPGNFTEIHAQDGEHIMTINNSSCVAEDVSYEQVKILLDNLK